MLVAVQAKIHCHGIQEVIEHSLLSSTELIEIILYSDHEDFMFLQCIEIDC